MRWGIMDDSDDVYDAEDIMIIAVGSNIQFLLDD